MSDRFPLEDSDGLLFSLESEANNERRDVETSPSIREPSRHQNIEPNIFDGLEDFRVDPWFSNLDTAHESTGEKREVSSSDGSSAGQVGNSSGTSGSTGTNGTLLVNSDTLLGDAQKNIKDLGSSDENTQQRSSISTYIKREPVEEDAFDDVSLVNSVDSAASIVSEASLFNGVTDLATDTDPLTTLEGSSSSAEAVSASRPVSSSSSGQLFSSQQSSYGSTSSFSTGFSKVGKPQRDRFSHNIIERKYRTNINAKLSELRNAVPTLRAADASTTGGQINFAQLEGLTPASRLNKASVFTKATEYIRHLESKNYALIGEINILRRIISHHNICLPPELEELPEIRRNQSLPQFINYGKSEGPHTRQFTMSQSASQSSSQSSSQ
ncbi:hypothetical protein FOA43_003874 [Brettanomyces nanus]|uniref:BHLH domain-containing protein n=1 Tax=Eeniella nana TaxID=13502 RepID=A0A875S8F0_EENNA|nr:uncharacterized protein FOA43_003874 [Brettanomyces nanus]QPG76485.1 hypothetical protein FOA43_003874 [Brettanomyces nanus]